MIFGLLGNLATTVLGSWVDEKKAKTKAKVRAFESDAKWAQSMTEASKTSWKDEFWTVLLSIPMVLAFMPGFAQYALEGFQVIAEMPPWYIGFVGAAISAAFGIRQFKDFRKK